MGFVILEPIAILKILNPAKLAFPRSLMYFLES
jgi:hypothetical protein